MKGYSVALPLKYDIEDGPYLMNKNLKDVVKQNLKMLILTNPGERMMNPDYGVGAKKLLFENRTDSVSSIDLSGLIQSQIAKYLPFIIINGINITDDIPEDLNTVFISISYSIPSIKEKDQIDLILSTN